MEKAQLESGPSHGNSDPLGRPAFLLLLLHLLFYLSGCSSIPSPQARLRAAEQLAANAGWHRIDIEAPPFVLSAWVPEAPPQKIAATEPLTVYIEGDGLAWQSGTSISPDPTPTNPLALRLALRQPGGRAAYLARPCQYRDLEHSPACSEKYWTSHRFAPEVIGASNLGVSRLETLFSASSLRLVGYSGGGAVAALVAARRNDVRQLITVAGNLDHAAWTNEHRLLPLAGSLNPIDFTSTLGAVPQIHLVGGNDEIVGEAVVRSFQGRFPAERRPELLVFKTYDHHCCWAENWPAIYRNVATETNRGETSSRQ